MKKLFASSTLLFASAALFAAASFYQSSSTEFAAPTSLSIVEERLALSGPTIPPIDEDDTGEGTTKLASGPTIPPIDEDDTGTGTQLAARV